MEGILPQIARRKSSLKKLAEVERAKKFRERARMASMGRPQFRYVKKKMENVTILSLLGMQNPVTSASPRDDISSNCSSCKYMLYMDHKVIVTDIDDSEMAEHKRNNRTSSADIDSDCDYHDIYNCEDCSTENGDEKEVELPNNVNPMSIYNGKFEVDSEVV